MTNADTAIATVFLGAAAAQELYGSHTHFSISLLFSSPFLLRIRQILHRCALSKADLLLKSGLSQRIVDGLMQSQKLDTRDLEATGSLDTCELAIKRPNSPTLAPSSPKATLEDPILTITDEEKKRATVLISKGVKLQYIAGLFGIVNPKIMHSWNDWKKRPKGEMERNLVKKREIEERLQNGEDPKSIKDDMKLKQKMYRELMGIAVGRIFTRSMYDNALQQMEVLGSLKVTARKCGVPAYFIKKWLTGKGIPEKDLIEEDEEATVEIKKKAIERFYETGNALIVSSEMGLKTPQVLERWVTQYQKAVDEREQYDVRGKL